MSRLRIAFMGSPDLGVPCLQALHDAPDLDLVQVVTLGDRRRGRRGKPVPTPVGAAALERGLPLLRWEKGERLAVEAELAQLELDLVVVIAFARILRPSLLELPRLGCMNLHASLLPWGRGASPIQQAILEELPESGWSAMLMDAGLDTGPVLARSALAVDPRWNSGDLYRALAANSAPILLESIRGYRDGTLVPEPQPDESATYAGKIPADAGAIDWSLSAADLDRRIRAYTPSPGCWCRRDGERLGVLEAEPASGDTDADAAPGTVVVSGGELRVACGEGALSLRSLKPAGKRPMPAADYLNGRPLVTGDRLAPGLTDESEPS